MLLFSIRVPSCGKAPISVRLVEQATRIDVQRTRECVRHLCNASRIETKVVSVSRIVEHIGGAKAHFTDQTFAIQAAQLLGRAIGAGLFAITPAGERGMCCKAIKLGNARVFPVTTL
ncbi:hypothetical protein AAY85_27710 [Pseudomonas amygdali pv. lachrymans]|nr:hypothetical protein AAY85_27710 [Pseudomonas amygdali pv. lachrymans]